MMNSVQLDGSQGEGGGQILRSALSLSVITGRPVQIHNIRAGRKKPGLMRQHLSCVTAAKALSMAAVSGAELGSKVLEFAPSLGAPSPAANAETDSANAPQRWEFDIGSAGSSMLVAQTIIPILLHQRQHVTVTIIGGTHNPLAPSADYIRAVFIPMLARMGAQLTLVLERYGFYPAGGGRVLLQIQPSTLLPISLIERGVLQNIHASAVVQGLPPGIADRELGALQQRLKLAPEQLERRVVDGFGVGNVVQITAQYAHCSAAFWALGEKSRSSEAVAFDAAEQFAAYSQLSAPVDAHLADQLLLPMTLAGGGEFVCTHATPHLHTNAEVLMAFGAAEIIFTPMQHGAVHVQVQAPALSR